MNIASQVLEPDLQKAASFVTLIHAQLDTFRNQVRYIDAGHGLATHVTKDGKITLLTTSNYPIGTGQNEEWQILNIEMAPGDTLILVSDGMLDVFDNALSMRRGLADIAIAANSAQEIIDKFKEIASSAKATDDVSALILRRT
jgi:serine phosphatase RsbU (regulator of sigma subunit)